MIDLAKLSGQGRAYSAARPWTPEELDALLALEKPVEDGGRGIGRLKAADYIRNGILTLEDYDRAVAAEFQPKTLEVAKAQLEETLKDNEFATVQPEVVPEAVAPAEVAPEVAPVPEMVADVPEPEAMPEEKKKSGKMK